MSETNSVLGLHILATLQSKKEETLLQYQNCIDHIDELLLKLKLEKVGASHHIFENNSFTLAVCLKESHICIHTWPEINRITLDVYLCNYSENNTDKVKSVSSEMIAFFEAEIISYHEIYR
jgi:S-adenosylmethionine decarboxylase